MFTKAKLYLAAGAAFVLGLLGIYWRGRSAGAEAERNERMSRRVDAMRKAKDVRDEVQDDPYFVDRAHQWVRKDDER